MERPSKPTAPPVCVERIPTDLKARLQWLVWRYVWNEDKEKWDKPPFSPRGRGHASSTDPRTWASLEAALEVYRRDSFDGIGFALTSGDPFCGVDLDGCINKEGEVAPWAQEIVDLLASYTEVSPSGTGIRIFLKGKLPPGRRRRDPIEAYETGRYLTVTGKHLEGTPLVIEERQEAIDAFHASYLGAEPAREETPRREPVPVHMDDRALLDRMFASRNGSEIRILWSGAKLPRHESTSDADLALCGHLAFWTGGDSHRMDQLFRQSERRRPKWDEIHRRNERGVATYGEMTIEEALSGKTEFYMPGNGHRNGHGSVQAVEAPHVTPDAPALPLRRGPALPDAAMAVYRHLNSSTGAWLQDYVRFAVAASPMTPEAFHEAAGLFAGAVAIARRLCLPVSLTRIFPNLYLLFIAQSTLYSKTTGYFLLDSLFRKAGLEHLLLPQSMTTEAMVEELSLNVPANFGSADSEARAAWLRERAFAAQRGWAIDEAHSLLDSFKRDYKAGIMAMLLNLFECPEVTQEQSKSRWRVTIRRAYLNFFGATTPASVAEYLNNPRFWATGLWPRFALIVPDSEPVWEFWPQPKEMPVSLIQGLRRIYDLFPTPEARMEETIGPDGNPRKEVQVSGFPEPAVAFLDEGVWQHWEVYSRVTRHEMLQEGEVDAQLFPSHGRMGTLAMKVALILATMDAERLPVRVTLPHYAHAQMIVEGWRAALYGLQGGAAGGEEASQQDKVLAAVTDLGEQGGLVRDVYRPLGMRAKECRALLEELEAAGQIEQFRGKAPNGRLVDMVRRVS